MIDLSASRLPPFAHQREAVEFFIDRPFAANFSEMGTGKTKVAIDTACYLFTKGVIDTCVILAPASVRAVWFDPEFGELAKHLWNTFPSEITEFHSTIRTWFWDLPPEDGGPSSAKKMVWIVSNYEYIRTSKHLTRLLANCSPKTYLILDESSAVKSWKSLQTKACRELRKHVGRVLLLNGTPIANNPMDLFAQGNLLSPKILECPYITHFRARYAVMGGYMAETRWGKIPTQVVRWQNLDDLQKRFAPYVIRRLKTECLDLPPKLEPVVLKARLTETTWAHYKAMRDDLVTWLSEGEVSQAAQAITKVMRLAQITSGFVGGVESLDEPMDLGDRPDWMPPSEDAPRLDFPRGVATGPLKEIGREKMNVFLDWAELRLEEDPALKLLVQCRFRAEVDRGVRELSERYPKMHVTAIRGGQTRSDRAEALRLLDPRSAPPEPVTVFMTSAGSMGLNLTASHTVFRLSRDYSLWRWLQSEDRVHRPGQTSPVSYTDVIAEGPKGQKTIDSAILKALLAKNDIAAWTAEAWRVALRTETEEPLIV